MDQDNIQNPSQYPDTTEFVRVLSSEILKEANVDADEKLIKIVSERIAARMLLEMVNMLTPEEAEKISKDMVGDESSQEKLVYEISNRIPDFQMKMAFVLSRIKQELIEDAKGLKKALS